MRTDAFADRQELSSQPGTTVDPKPGLQAIKERFRKIGLGVNLPREGRPWSTLGELVHWCDLIGLEDGGLGLECPDPDFPFPLLQWLGV